MNGGGVKVEIDFGIKLLAKLRHKLTPEQRSEFS